MTTRISGLSSGMDIDALVKQLMKTEKTRVDTVFKKKTKIEWQQEAYRNISTAIVDFRNNKLTKYNLSSAMNAKTAEVSGNTNAVSAKASSSATNGKLTVDVQQVATSANVVLSLGSVTKLGDLADFDPSQVTINGVKIEGLDENSTVGDLVAKINGTAGTNVTALTDGKGNVSLTSTKTGELKDESGSAVGITLGNLDKYAPPLASRNKGTDSIAVVNGLTYKQSSNSLTVNGVELTFKQASGGVASTITTTVDADTIMKTIKSFVDDYNNLINTINTALNEETFRKFDPLTTEQEEEMTENQVELWNKKAKSGLLKGDSILSETVSSLRTSVISMVGTSKADALNIQSIGITTGSWQEYGKLTIDEDKLREAIMSDPNRVMKLFTGNAADPSETTDGGLAIKGKGIFNQFSDILMTSLDQLAEKAGTSKYSTSTTTSFLENSLLSTQIRDLETKEDQLNQWLLRKEDSYYKQFTAMETAISKYNSISTSLSGLFS